MAPVQSTLPKPIRDAYAAVLQHPNSLLASKAADMSRFQFYCPDLGNATPAAPKENPSGTMRGVWRLASTERLVIPLIGVVDLENSKIGAYGNLDRVKYPTLKKMKQCKFIVAIRFPLFQEGHPDVAVTEGIVNQMERLSEMQDFVNARITEPGRYNNAVRFAEKNGEPTGCMVTSLGTVYTTTRKETTAAEFFKRSPTKKATDPAPTVPDIVCDPKHYTQTVEGANVLKHNDELPIRFIDGARVGRTGEDLERELTDGRWVRADCEFIIWNITEEGSTSRTFQLSVVNMLVLPRVPSILDGPGMTYLSPNALNIGDGETKASSSKAAQEEKEEGKGESDASTLSSSPPRGEKRAGGVSGDEHTAKKAREG